MTSCGWLSRVLMPISIPVRRSTRPAATHSGTIFWTLASSLSRLIRCSFRDPGSARILLAVTSGEERLQTRSRRLDLGPAEARALATVADEHDRRAAAPDHLGEDVVRRAVDS